MKSCIEDIENIQDEESLVISCNYSVEYLISIFDIMKFEYDKSMVKRMFNNVKYNGANKYNDGNYIELLSNTGEKYFLIMKNKLLLIEKQKIVNDR